MSLKLWKFISSRTAVRDVLPSDRTGVQFSAGFP